MTEAESERLYERPHPDGGTCRACHYCAPSCSDEVPGDEYGVCTERADEPMVVSLDERHGWDECWTGDPS